MPATTSSIIFGWSRSAAAPRFSSSARVSCGGVAPASGWPSSSTTWVTLVSAPEILRACFGFSAISTLEPELVTM